MAEVCLGLRVVRGPSWDWPAQDGGEGGVGTVVEVGGKPESNSPAGTVVVLWDTGNKTNYRCGYSNKFDLRVYDTSCATGADHLGVTCDSCLEQDIYGIRWKCRTCDDYDLCNRCYHAGKHDEEHPFWMMTFPTVPRKDVGVRQGVHTIPIKGIFPGAKVMRGLDWKWGEQDGVQGATGKVDSLRGFNNITSKSLANVTWPSGESHLYRAGHIGKVDLRCVELGDGGSYYSEHLPLLVADRVTELDKDELSRPVRSGDLVQVTGLEVDIWKMMQEGLGWSDDMEKLLGQVGEVEWIDRDTGAVATNYRLNRVIKLHPAVVTKVLRLSIGDRVKMMEDQSVMKAMMIGHGEWTRDMADFVGEVGTVRRRMPNGDVRTRFGSHTWIFHPGCLVRVSTAKGDDFTQEAVRSAEDTATEDGVLSTEVAQAMARMDEGGLQDLLLNVLAGMGGLPPAAMIARAIQDGDVGKVRDLVQRNKDEVNTPIGDHNQTCLHIAAGLGMVEIMEVLVENGAKLTAEDKDGDTPVHFAVIGNEPTAIAALHRLGAEINACNHKASTALHSACFRGHEASVQELLSLKANVTIQDGAGDTPLHDAVACDQGEIVDLLLDADAPIAITNDRGFNLIHHAALKGHHYVMEKLLRKSPDLVNVSKSDGFTPLHLAAFNNHVGVATVLLRQPSCKIDSVNNERRTPLMLAVVKGFTACTELLVSYGASLEAEDESGDTVMHLALYRQSVADIVRMGEESSEQSPVLGQIMAKMGLGSATDNQTAAIACFLAQEGCSLTYRNYKGKTPLDMCVDPKIRTLVETFHKPKGWSSFHGSNAVGGSTKLSRPVTGASDVAGIAQQMSKLAGGGDSTKPTVIAMETDGQSPVVVVVATPLVDCSICDNKANIRFTPCGHSVLCETCAQRANRCSVRSCKAAITGRVKLEYKPAPQAAVPATTAGPSSGAGAVGGPCRLAVAGEEACMMCENFANVKFEPCGHVVTCGECCARTKKCIRCKTKVTKMSIDGSPISVDAAPAPANPKPPSEAETCPICLDEPMQVVFMCGHRTCATCSDKVFECPICRKHITHRIMMF